MRSTTTRSTIAEETHAQGSVRLCMYANAAACWPACQGGACSCSSTIMQDPPFTQTLYTVWQVAAQAVAQLPPIGPRQSMAVRRHAGCHTAAIPAQQRQDCLLSPISSSRPLVSCRCLPARHLVLAQKPTAALAAMCLPGGNAACHLSCIPAPLHPVHTRELYSCG
jgi:hypothetical protein